MNHQPTSSRRLSKRRLKRPLLVCGVGVVLLTLGAVAAVSRQSYRSEPPKPANPVLAETKYITVKVAGRNVQVDSQTGQLKPLTVDEAQKLAQGLKELVDQSSEGLTEIRHADGSVSVDLQGRFQALAVARRDTNGKISQSCVDNRRSAAAFFGIDPKLLGSEGKGTRVTTYRRTTGETSNRSAQNAEVQ